MKTVLDLDELVFTPPEPDCLLALPGLPGSGSKLYDRSSYGHLGTVTGATWQRLPSGLWCLSYDGVDDYTNLGNSNNFNVSHITLELWVALADVDKPADQYLICKGDLDPWDIRDNGSSLSFYVKRASDSTYSSAGFSTSLLHDNEWCSVVGTYDGVKVRLYLNGELKGGPVSFPGTIKVTTANVYLGGMGAYYPTGGKIAFPRIYHRALNALEINNHFHQEKHFFGVWSR